MLPPIDQPSGGALGAVTGADLGVAGFVVGGAGMVANAACQTNDERIIAREWAAEGKTAVRGSVSGELRPWWGLVAKVKKSTRLTNELERNWVSKTVYIGPKLYLKKKKK